MMRRRATTSKLGKSAKSADDLRAQLDERVPQGSTRDEVVAWLRAAQIDFSDEGDALRFTLRGPNRGLFVGVTWMVTLVLTNERLTRIVVDEGLTGP
jgi:hypothetical protein